MKRFSSRGRWQRSRAQLWPKPTHKRPKTDPTPTKIKSCPGPFGSAELWLVRRPRGGCPLEARALRGPGILSRLSSLTVCKVSDRRRNMPKRAQNRSEPLCAGLWVPCRVFWGWFGAALGSHPIRNRRFLAGSLKVFGALLAQPSLVL